MRLRLLEFLAVELLCVRLASADAGVLLCKDHQARAKHRATNHPPSESEIANVLLISMCHDSRRTRSIMKIQLL